MKPPWGPLLQVLRDPSHMLGLGDDDWDLVLRQAVAAGLAGRLGALAQDGGLLDRLLPQVRHVLQAWLTVAEQQRRAVHWELVHLGHDLRDLPGPVVLLKGAAYAAAGLPPGRGRLFSDIDILVPRAQIDAAEAALMLGGWVGARLGAYDQRYYRQWMHELPPMTHIRRQTVLDLHHSLLPATARLATPAGPIFDAARPLDRAPRFSIPAPCDQVLHSATHLFHEGEWAHGLRDLVDLDALINEHQGTAGFWDALVARARELGLGRPLFYALRYCHQVLRTPVPAEAMAACPSQPSPLGAALMDRLFVPAFGAAHASWRTASTDFAEAALYVRSHWLRMPAHLLLQHLVRKAWQRRFEAWQAGRVTKKLPGAEADLALGLMEDRRGA